MGTDIRSILRVGLTTKAVTAATPILAAANVKRNQPDYTGADLKPNMTGIGWYTVEYQSDDAGTLSAVIENTTTGLGSTIAINTTVGNKLEKFDFFIDADWTFNLTFSVDTTFGILAIAEHGGAV